MLWARAAALVLALGGAGMRAGEPPDTATSMPATTRAGFEVVNGVRIVWDNPAPTLQHSSVVEGLDRKDDRWRARYLPMVEEEISLYPKGYHARQGLDEVVLVGSIKVAGQDRGAMPDAAGRRLYLNPYTGMRAPVFQRHCIHHEYFHFLMDRWHGTPYFVDPEWKAFDPEAKFGNGGKFQRNGMSSILNHPQPGFVDGYAMSAPEEDMSEVFAVLMTKAETAKVEAWAKEDAVLAKKLEFIRAHYLPTSATTRP